MDFKPNEFFLGLVDFTAIFLPGCLLTGILLAVEAKQPFSQTPLYCLGLAENTSTIFWVCFVFSAYTIGYFLSSVASGLDTYSDKIRDHIYPHEKFMVDCFLESKGFDLKSEDAAIKEQMAFIRSMISQGKNHEFATFRKGFLKDSARNLFHFLFEFEWKLEESKVLPKLSCIKSPTGLEGSINNFQWSSIILDSLYPVAAEKANRAMAASKFFRSLVLVFFMALVFQCCQWLPEKIPFWGWLGMMLLSFREYVVQRQKSINAAYRAILTFATLPDVFKKEK